jgi:transcriptional regulator with XRE-family HTH domain
MDDAVTRRALGNRLRALRKSMAMTQIDAADALNMNRATYSQYESGYIDLSVSRLVAICMILKTTPNALLGFGGGGSAELTLTHTREAVAQLANLVGLTVVPNASVGVGAADPDQQE